LNLKRSHLAREIIETVLLTLLIFFVIRFVIQSYHVEGVSMVPSLQDNEYVLVNKAIYLLHPPERGDVIVFHNPTNTSVDFIKRVIGVPGDTVQVDANHISINGVQLDEPYISSPATQVTNTWKISPGKYFVLGDNRPVSDDSRYWGCVPQSYIVGKAVAVYWPTKNWEFISTYSSVYAHVKTGQATTTSKAQSC
jgi:signal peptidase I